LKRPVFVNLSRSRVRVCIKLLTRAKNSLREMLLARSPGQRWPSGMGLGCATQPGSGASNWCPCCPFQQAGRAGALFYDANRRMLAGLAMPEPDHRFKITEMGLQIDPHSLRAWISCITQDGKSLLLETDRVELQELCQEVQRQLNSRPLPA